MASPDNSFCTTVSAPLTDVDFVQIEPRADQPRQAITRKAIACGLDGCERQPDNVQRLGETFMETHRAVPRASKPSILMWSACTLIVLYVAEEGGRSIAPHGTSDSIVM